MAKKNNRKKIQERYKVIKNLELAKVQKNQEKLRVKALENEMKEKLIGLDLEPGSVVMSDADAYTASGVKNKKRRTGVNFSRSIEGSKPLRSRDKAIIKAMLKRRRKIQD